MEDHYSNNSTSLNYSIKVILVGNSGVGKTSIINRLITNEFENSVYPTTIADYFKETIKIEENNIDLNIWDTVGQEKFLAMMGIFLRESQIVIFVYDVTNKKSFDDLPIWYKETQNHLNLLGVCANKIDLVGSEVVSEKEGENIAKKFNANFYQTTCKDGIGIREMFESLAKQFIVEIGFDTSSRGSVILKKKKSKKGGCC